MSGPAPEEMTPLARHQLAEQLRAQHSALLGVLEETQTYASLREHLGQGAQELARIAQLYWPAQAWEGTNTGQPRHGDWHVKVASVITDGEVNLRVRTQRVDAQMQLADGERGVLDVPLELAEHVLKALDEHVSYWHENPPSGGRQD